MRYSREEKQRLCETAQELLPEIEETSVAPQYVEFSDSLVKTSLKVNEWLQDQKD